MLECSGLVVRYGPIDALRRCDVVAESGTITAILGANGAGKSSLMKAIAGLVPAVEGSIKVDGADVTALPAHRRAQLGISMAMEGRRLFHKMTVDENLRLAGEFRGHARDMREGLQRVFDWFPVLAARQHSPAGLLSGGQQQMLILGAALIHSPKHLLLDEPSLGLAPAIVQQIFGVIAAACRDSGTTIILSEQVIAQALKVAHRVYVLRRGEVVREGFAADLARDPALTAAYLGGGSHNPPRDGPGA